VVNAQGAISLRDHHALTQRMLLLQEGVAFDARARVDLTRFGWRPRRRTTAKQKGTR
jgi:alkylated DNA nucleotide flippase Atl1